MQNKIQTKTHKYSVEWLCEGEETDSQLAIAYSAESMLDVKKMVENAEKSNPFWELFGGIVYANNNLTYQVFPKGKV